MVLTASDIVVANILIFLCIKVSLKSVCQFWHAEQVGIFFQILRLKDIFVQK